MYGHALFFPQRGTFEVQQLDSIHVQRYLLEGKDHFFILRLSKFNLTDGPILDNSLPTVGSNYFL